MDRRQGEQVQFANTPGDRKCEVGLVRDYYSSKALFDWWREQPFRRGVLSRYHTHIERLMREQGRGLTIVEVGSGVGVDLTLLVQRYPATRAIGFDLSPEGVRTSSRYAMGQYFIGDAETTALSDDCCDVVLLVNVVHHFYRYPNRLLSEVDRILRPGGLLLVSDPNAGKVRRRMVGRITSGSMKLVHLWTRMLHRPVFQLEIPHPSPTERCMTYEELREVLEMRFEIIDSGFTDRLTHLARWHAFPHLRLYLLDQLIHWIEPRAMIFYFFACKSPGQGGLQR